MTLTLAPIVSAASDEATDVLSALQLLQHSNLQRAQGQHDHHHHLLSILVIIAIIIFYEIIISILVIIAVIYILLCYHHYLSNFLWDWDGPRFGYSDPVLFWPLVIKLEIFHIKIKLRSNSQFRSASQSNNLFRNLQQYPAPFFSIGNCFKYFYMASFHFSRPALTFPFFKGSVGFGELIIVKR